RRRYSNWRDTLTLAFPFVNVAWWLLVRAGSSSLQECYVWGENVQPVPLGQIPHQDFVPRAATAAATCRRRINLNGAVLTPKDAGSGVTALDQRPLIVR